MTKENKYIKEFENQPMIRVLKDAQDFSKYQYELIIKLFEPFLLKALSSQRKEIIEKIETYFGHISNDGNGKPMIISTKQIGEDLKNLIKEDE